MPSLADLETNLGNYGFEVVIVNRTIDPVLEELVQIAHCIALDCPASNVSVLVQKLAEFVTGHMGGPVKDANIMFARLVIKLKLVALVSTGQLSVTVLADNIKLPCRLVKGSHYTGVEDDAVNMLKLEHERDFLVDLMAAPGTLIPADVFSAKDTALKSYNPSLSKILTIQFSDDVGGGSSSKNTEYLYSFSGPSGDSAVVTSIISNKMSPNQLDHLPSTVIGASLYKGSRGTNPTVDSARMNLNEVPYSQNSKDDSKNLFADLNPFQIKGTDKTYLQNKSTESKVDDLQRQKMNIYNYVDGLFPKINRESYEFHQSASALTSSTKSEKVHPHGFKLSGDSNLPNNDNKSRDRLSDMGQSLTSTTGQFNNAPMVQDVSTNYNEEKSNGWQDVQNNTVDMVKDQESNEVHLHDHRKAKPDKCMGKNLKMKNPESPRSPVDCITERVDQLFDDVDVGDFEIAWEDLLIGERIGLGKAYDLFSIRCPSNGLSLSSTKVVEDVAK
ncbi:hypothetical protein SLEP1_g55637 [Rubroshorea leprosula]|uniref:EDR1/CTR1/ARMC3-like peptidase-like domain-containing protein n=1 Tax=Rubroshorea leprosula TaxID=152421 RepID=A0AAV5MFX4_9ROSI|nr:hypothetical protein SLEP1_g55637 [Rubroshorea leprosula]